LKLLFWRIDAVIGSVHLITHLNLTVFKAELRLI
jgi:hypothetical protein